MRAAREKIKRANAQRAKEAKGKIEKMWEEKEEKGGRKEEKSKSV